MVEEDILDDKTDNLSSCFCLKGWLTLKQERQIN